MPDICLPTSGALPEKHHLPMSKNEAVDAVSSRELEILDALWKHSPQTIREVCEAIYGDTSASLYATVQSLLDRLEKKGWVQRDRSSFKHTFTPTKQRSDFVGQQIQDVADSVCGGSIAALLGQLAKSETLSAKERQELRKLIDQR